MEKIGGLVGDSIISLTTSSSELAVVSDVRAATFRTGDFLGVKCTLTLSIDVLCTSVAILSSGDEDSRSETEGCLALAREIEACLIFRIGVEISTTGVNRVDRGLVGVDGFVIAVGSTGALYSASGSMHAFWGAVSSSTATRWGVGIPNTSKVTLQTYLALMLCLCLWLAYPAWMLPALLSSRC